LFLVVLFIFFFYFLFVLFYFFFVVEVAAGQQPQHQSPSFLMPNEVDITKPFSRLKTPRLGFIAHNLSARFFMFEA